MEEALLALEWLEVSNDLVSLDNRKCEGELPGSYSDSHTAIDAWGASSTERSPSWLVLMGIRHRIATPLSKYRR